ncbi:hypothetical protein MJ1_0112 [Nanobdella aerobiophila]|uniref:Uncharacterized protein n=1 Tax=Nanobdella aerobiophila TaxID=2586965 RepID=A0A915SHX5_9ARCH|nr:hypothetical protein [Nanobdella aerobiophila]BBL45287.1 hypothetical protein MJ1_0112 [Nanobdella aerobiophila]
MKNDIAIDQAFIIIVAIISISIFLYIIYDKFFLNSKQYYCESIVSTDSFSPSCLKYYPETQTIEFNNQTEDYIENAIAGLVISCYNKNINTNNLFNVCYDVYIDENLSINSTNILYILNRYSNFNTNNLLFHYENNQLNFTPYQSIFIIYNNTNIILWQ